MEKEEEAGESSSPWWEYGAPIVLIYLAVCVLPGDQLFFSVFFAPESVLFVLLVAVYLVWRLYWRGTEHNISSQNYKDNQVLFTDKGEIAGGHVAIHSFLNALFKMGGPVIDAQFTFWINELFRQNNPLSHLLAEPVCEWTWGSDTPSVMHFRRLQDSKQGEHIFSMDFIYTGDARGTIKAAGVSVAISNMRIAGRILCRMHPQTGEMFICFESSPMLNIGLKVMDGLSPDILRQKVLSWIEGLLDARVEPHWTYLGLMGETLFGSIQTKLNEYRNLAKYNRAAQLAFDAGCARMVQANDEFFPLMERDNEAILDKSVHEVEQEVHVEAEADWQMVQNARMMSSPLVFLKGLLIVNSESALCFFEDDEREVPMEIAPGVQVDAKSGIVCGSDDYGQVVACMSEKKVVLVSKKAKAKVYIWRQLAAGPSKIIGLLMTKDMWHLVCSDEFDNILDVCITPFQANVAPKIVSLGSGVASPYYLKDKVIGIVIFSGKQYSILDLDKKTNALAMTRKVSWNLSMSNVCRPACCCFPKELVICSIQEQKLFLNEVDVTANLRERKVSVSGCMGSPSNMVVLRGDLVVVFRDIMGHINCVWGPKITKMKHVNLSIVNNLSDLSAASADISLSLVGLSSMKVLWTGADGKIHKLSGPSPGSLHYEQIGKHDVQGQGQ